MLTLKSMSVGVASFFILTTGKELFSAWSTVSSYGKTMSRGYFTRVENCLFEEGKYLTPAAKLVYVVLCSFRNNKSGRTYPSYEKIMTRSGLGKNKVAAALNELHAFGWITRRKVFIGGNHYELLYPWNAQPELPREWPTKEEAKEYARMVRERKPHYGIKPWDEDDVPTDHEETEDYDDDPIPF